MCLNGGGWINSYPPQCFEFVLIVLVCVMKWCGLIFLDKLWWVPVGWIFVGDIWRVAMERFIRKFVSIKAKVEYHQHHDSGHPTSSGVIFRNGRCPISGRASPIRISFLEGDVANGLRGEIHLSRLWKFSPWKSARSMCWANWSRPSTFYNISWHSIIGINVHY